MIITSYEAICNLGNNINEIYNNAIVGNTSCFDTFENYIPNEYIRVGVIKTELPSINSEDFNIRCNKLLLKNLELLNDKINKLNYPKERIGIVVATTNSGVEEFEKSKNTKHFELGNPAQFLKEHLHLKGFCTTVSTACSSGLKAFSLAKDLLENKVSDAVIVACVDSLSKIPIYGFNSLEILSDKLSMPFSKNSSGMNIGEASVIFIVENNDKQGINIMSIGENSDVYHSTTPDPQAKEAISAIKSALEEAKIQPQDVDYINAHGTGTFANDIMEANAIHQIFPQDIPVSSTKPMTGHCLGAAAGIETALCCKLLDSFDGRLYSHIYDGEYNPSLPKINLVGKNKKYQKCNVCICNSFGFGGTNAIMIMGKKYE